MNLFLSPTILKLEELCRYFSWESWGCLHDVRGQVLRWACWPQWWGVRSGWRVSSKVTRLVNWAWLGLWYLHPASHWRRLVVERLEIVSAFWPLEIVFVCPGTENRGWRWWAVESDSLEDCPGVSASSSVTTSWQATSVLRTSQIYIQQTCSLRLNFLYDIYLFDIVNKHMKFWSPVKLWLSAWWWDWVLSGP